MPFLWHSHRRADKHSEENFSIRLQHNSNYFALLRVRPETVSSLSCDCRVFGVQRSPEMLHRNIINPSNTDVELKMPTADCRV